MRNIETPEYIETLDTRHTVVGQLNYLSNRIFQQIGKVLDEHIENADMDAFKGYLDDVKLLVEWLHEWSLDNAQATEETLFESDSILRELTIFEGYLDSVKRN